MDFWKNPILAAGEWLSGIFVGWGMNADAAHVLAAFVGILLLISVVMVLDIFLVWTERKIVARFQDRIGPNRLGPFGLIQPFADIIKLIIKENIYPVGVDKMVYNLAPIIMMTSVLLLWAVLPLTSFLGLDLNVGVLYLIGVGALGTLSIIMAGWSSNNKYALLGAFRQVAVMISYEIPMVAALLIPTILAGSMGINSIVAAQGMSWYIVLAPLAFLLFLISATAELGRAPFDLTEAESELIAGHHIEYSGMKFGLFYASELLHTFTFGGLIAAFFFGGWQGPWVEEIPMLGLLYFLVKATIGYWLFGWIKYTMPRIRIDKMMDLNWKFLVPFSFVLVMYVALMHALLKDTNFYALGMFLSNILLGWVTLEVLRRSAHKERVQVEGSNDHVVTTSVVHGE